MLPGRFLKRLVWTVAVPIALVVLGLALFHYIVIPR